MSQNRRKSYLAGLKQHSQILEPPRDLLLIPNLTLPKHSARQAVSCEIVPVVTKTEGGGKIERKQSSSKVVQSIFVMLVAFKA